MTTTDDTSTGRPAPAGAPPAPDPTYTVNRVQDGAQVRAELSLEDAQGECAILNAQARMPAGQTVDGLPIYAGMFLGEISQYEVRSTSGLVV